MSQFGRPKIDKPDHVDVLCEVWRAAQAETIGLLLRVPDQALAYWKSNLYQVRSWLNDKSLYELALRNSRFPEEANLEIVHKSVLEHEPNSISEIDYRGVLDLNLGDDDA